MKLAGALTQLFEFQHFEGNSRLQALIDETEARCLHGLSDDDLEWVSAAGEEASPDDPWDGETHE